jgi:hypothetical protein
MPQHAFIEAIQKVPQGGSFGEGPANVAYPINPTSLPELCALIVNVTSSSTSYYRFGMYLPSVWNSRFLAVGNGGFAGGINWLDMAPGRNRHPLIYNRQNRLLTKRKNLQDLIMGSQRSLRIPGTTPLLVIFLGRY